MQHTSPIRLFFGGNGRAFFFQHYDAAMFSELHCVADQVDEDLPQLAFVGPDKPWHILLALDRELQLALLRSKAKQSIQVLQHRMEIEISRLQLHPSGFDLRRSEERRV